MSTVLPALVLLSWFLTPSGAIDCEPSTRYPHPLNCSKFIICDKLGNPKTFTCPRGLHYNGNASFCDWPENANCKLEKNLTDSPVKKIFPDTKSNSTNTTTIYNSTTTQGSLKSKDKQNVVAENKPSNYKNETTVKEDSILNVTKVEKKNITTKYITLNVREKLKLENLNRSSNFSEDEGGTGDELKVNKLLYKNNDTITVQNTNLTSNDNEKLNTSTETLLSVQRKVIKKEINETGTDRKTVKAAKEDISKKETIEENEERFTENKNDEVLKQGNKKNQEVNEKEGDKTLTKTKKDSENTKNLNKTGTVVLPTNETQDYSLLGRGNVDEHSLGNETTSNYTLLLSDDSKTIIDFTGILSDDGSIPSAIVGFKLDDDLSGYDVMYSSSSPIEDGGSNNTSIRPDTEVTKSTE